MYDDEWNRLTPEEKHERRKEHGTWPARFLKTLRFKLHKKQSPLRRMYDTGELTLRRRIQLHALELYLSPALFARIRPVFHHFAEYQLSLSRYVRYRCDHALPREVWRLPAGSPSRMTKARLLLVISLVFHPDVSAQIAANIEEFDEIAGVECADAFIGETGLRDWLKYLLDYTLSGLAAASRPFLRYDEAAWFDTDDEGIPEKIPGPSPEWIKILSEHRILNIQQRLGIITTRATFAIAVEIVPAAKQASSSKGVSSIKKPPHKDDEDDDDDQPKGNKKHKFKTL
ncbi:hypothetical protein K4K49_007826 [Colletotrichum sp. SAR 10_70]|nr:hypothetical protein K4K50_007594 [Colletotrichum sp. SAR 10_71]KAI8158677.1 hypothetical protein K4K49_007826 [Colletotrichum sp. SAR 10_70]